VGEHGVEHLPADAALSMGRGDGYFVDPEFGGFVGVDVVNGGDEADNLVTVYCCDEVVARVVEKFGRELRLNGVVEEALRRVQ
jgi:hypothetical protein